MSLKHEIIKRRSNRGCLGRHRLSKAKSTCRLLGSSPNGSTWRKVCLIIGRIKQKIGILKMSKTALLHANVVINLNWRTGLFFPLIRTGFQFARNVPPIGTKWNGCTMGE